MSLSDTAVPGRLSTPPLVRAAVPADYPAIRDVVIAAYRQYADLLERDIFSPYLADLLDVDTHARFGHLFVVEAGERVCAYAAWYPDASVRWFPWPAGWATGRALAVHPDARGNGAAHALLAAGEHLALQAGAPVLAFHTHSYMTGAIALYERMGYRRAPEFDFDVAERFGRFGAAPVMSLAYYRNPTQQHVTPWRTR